MPGVAARSGAASPAVAGSAATARPRPPTASAARAPSSEIPAVAASAGRYPEVTLAADPRCPLAVNTAVTIATPNAAPNRCIVLLTPEARPISAGPTAFSVAVGAGGHTIG